MSPEMKAVVHAFESQRPSMCTVRPQANPIYTLITIDGWPRAVHYEFRDRTDGRELYVELHIEDPQYLYISRNLKTAVTEIGEINGFKLRYFESRLPPHRKKWPSASIEVPKSSDGQIGAAVMLGFIAATRELLSIALHKGKAS